MVTYIYFLAPLLTAVFLAFNMGGSGTAPSFSAAYGANLIRKELIPGVFGIFVLLGALIASGKVMKTIGSEVLPAAEMDLVSVSIILLASALSILFANLLKVPQSTSQSTVFALVGCAVFLGNLQSRKLLTEIIPTWLITPIVSFLLTYSIGGFLFSWQKKMKLFSSSQNIAALKYITLGCSCYVAFAIGSNNVANSAGLITSMLLKELNIQMAGAEGFVALLSIILIAPWFGIGSSFLGSRVLTTTAKDIIKIGPLSAAFIAVTTATLLLLASTLRGIPTSLVQMNTAAIIAIGMIKNGPRNVLSRKIIVKLITVWAVAPLIAFIIAYILMAGTNTVRLL